MDAVTLTIPATVVTYLAMHLGVPWIRGLIARRSERPPAHGSSGDKMRAIAAELSDGDTVKKVNELHEALASRDGNDKGYIIPRQLQHQTTLLGVIRDELVKQTSLARQNVSQQNVPRPDGIYRGGGGSGRGGE